MIDWTDIVPLLASTDIGQRLAPIAKSLLRNKRFQSLDRTLIAKTYVQGSGIEIGALNYPLRVPRSAHVTYVDRMRVADLRKQYPEFRRRKLARVDIVSDGERLPNIANATQDFVIANHFLEHCQDPITAIVNMHRVLREGGILYLALPDKTCTFDVDRPVTTIEHLLKDYHDGPEWSRRQHFEEWARFVDGAATDENVQQRAAHLMDIDYSIHFHVWTPNAMVDFFQAVRRDVGLGLDMELMFKNGIEVIFVLRRSAA